MILLPYLNFCKLYNQLNLLVLFAHVFVVRTEDTVHTKELLHSKQLYFLFCLMCNYIFMPFFINLTTDTQQS